MQLTETEKRAITNFGITESQWENLPRFSLQEIVDKTQAQRKIINANMDATKPAYDYFEANLTDGLSREDQAKVIKSLANIPLGNLIAAAAPELGLKLRAQEFLAKSGTTGIGGAAYLIPDKIHQVLFDSAVETDITPEISMMMIPPEQIPGATLKVDVELDDKFKPYRFSSGGQIADQQMQIKQPYLDFTQPWGINFRIANDLIEDSQFNMIELHIRRAGLEFGEFATNEALTVLKTATDGDGSVNGGASGNANETKFVGGGTTDLQSVFNEIHGDKYTPTHIVAIPHVWVHSLVSTANITTSLASEPWAYEANVNGLPSKMLGCQVIWNHAECLATWTTASHIMHDAVTIMFAKPYALLTGRKRWLRIENYSDPVRDLVGATITARQDSITIYNDSIGVITETAG